MALKNVIHAAPLATVDSATLGAGYVAFNLALPAPCVVLRIINASDVGVSVSYDGGAHAHDYVLAASTLQIDFQANNSPGNYPAALPQGLVVSLSGAAGAGNIYLASYYQPQGG